MKPYYESKGVQLFQGDCREALPCLPDGSVDSVITDPPYELGFMGKGWDRSGIAYDVSVWRECLRVLKPGGHLLAFGGSRTYHRLACAIEDAGFEIRDQIQWIYGSGFPKSLDVSKAIDASSSRTSEAIESLKDELRRVFGLSGLTLSLFNERCGFEASGYLRKSSTWASVLPSPEKWWKMREVIGCDDSLSSEFKQIEREVVGVNPWTNSANHFVPGEDHTKRLQLAITAPTTDAAKQWNGWGTALKPAHEPIVLARKPLIGTVAENVLKHGTGGLNIDGCRVRSVVLDSERRSSATGDSVFFGIKGDDGERHNALGRWPSNLLHDGSDEVLAGFPETTSGEIRAGQSQGTNFRQSHARVAQYDVTASSGSAARFFYCAKATKKDRGEGNNHPTVKPTKLMRYLCRLVTPPNGIVLDPFGGSGSTAKACGLEGFRCVLIEKEPEYCELLKRRIVGQEALNFEAVA